MSLFISILFLIAGIIVMLLIIALFMRKEHYVKCDIVIYAPQQKVFDYVKLLKNQDTFNKHAKADPGRIETFKGTDGTVGYIYSWSGNKSAGVGEKEIKNIVEGKSMEAEIRFVKPMAATARIIMDTEALSDTETNVSWSNAGILKYPLNIMIPSMEKMISKDMDGSLLTLKNLLEKKS